jgi:hypothetical protein
LFAQSLIPGGYLLIETIPGCGGNYVHLPKVNQLREDLSQMFDFELYKENPVGPSAASVVIVDSVAEHSSRETVLDGGLERVWLQGA